MNALEVQLLKPFMREHQVNKIIAVLISKAEQETRKILQEAYTADQVIEHLSSRIDRRETLIAQVIYPLYFFIVKASVAYMEAQFTFFRDVTNLYGDLSSTVGLLSDKVKKANQKSTVRVSL
jgi:hypothetical protein